MSILTKSILTKSIRTVVFATAAGGMAFVPNAVAGAAEISSDGESAMIILDQLCEARGGLPVNSPYAIARCQGARANKGFDIEQQICEGLAEGRFVVSVSTTHMNRAAWSCIATSPAT